jgi:hypothetical protein
MGLRMGDCCGCKPAERGGWYRGSMVVVVVGGTRCLNLDRTFLESSSS